MVWRTMINIYVLLAQDFSLGCHAVNSVVTIIETAEDPFQVRFRCLCTGDR